MSRSREYNWKQHNRVYRRLLLRTCGQGIPQSFWWGVRPESLKPVPYFRPKSVIIHTLFRPEVKIDTPFQTSKIDL